MRNSKNIRASGEGCIVKSMYLEARTVEFVDQPPA
jgi:hypothetical protein